MLVEMEVGRDQAEVAVKELRLFISLYEDAGLRPESRLARQLETARKAVAGYEQLEKEHESQTAA